MSETMTSHALFLTLLVLALCLTIKVVPGFPAQLPDLERGLQSSVGKQSIIIFTLYSEMKLNYSSLV